MVGHWQILIVVLIVIVLFGARRLPDLGKSLGQAIRGFKKGISEDDKNAINESSENHADTSTDENKKS